MLELLKMELRLYVFIFFIFGVLSCISEKEEVISLSEKNSVSELSDTLFFSDVENMLIYKDKLYFVEHNREQIICLNLDLTLYRIFGERGVGPKEFGYISGFTFKDDSLYVLDSGNARLYVSDLLGNIVQSFRLTETLPIMAEYRFVVNKEKDVVISSVSEHGAFADFNLSSMKVEFWGERYSFSNEIWKRIRNGQHLLLNDSLYVSVSDNMPFVNIYSQSEKKCIYKYDYSKIEIVKKRIAALKSAPPRAINTYGIVCEDAYITDKNVYLLLCSIKNGLYCANKIASFKLSPEVSLEAVFELPGNVYTSFCVIGNNIYAFNKVESKLEHFFF